MALIFTSTIRREAYPPAPPDNKGAELKGLQGWQGPGWTAPDPGSRHYPEVRGGAVIALFYLPAGRISYDFEAPPDR
nr:DUF4863 family protein [Bradyrhizobium sp. Rc2d]